MPERFDLIALIETEHERSVRAELIGRFRARFFSWLERPKKVFLLGRNHSQHLAWDDAGHLLEAKLSDTDLLFVYLASQSDNGEVILCISRNAQTANYGISLPTTEIAMRQGEVLAALEGMYSEIAGMGLTGIVAAGAELELEAPSIDAAIRSTSEPGSLVAVPVSCEGGCRQSLRLSICRRERRCRHAQADQQLSWLTPLGL